MSKTKRGERSTRKGLRILHKLLDGDIRFSRFAWSPNGSLLAGSSESGLLTVWNVDSGEIVAKRVHPGRMISAVVWSPDGSCIAYASADITVWDFYKDSTIYELRFHPQSVWSMAWSSNDELASASHDRSIAIWNMASGTRTKTLNGHTAEVISVAWSPDGTVLASGSGDSTVRLWSDSSGKGRILQGHRGAVAALAWAGDGRRLESGSADRTEISWNPITGRQARLFEGHTAAITSISYSADNQILLSAAEDGNAILWQSGTAGRLTSFRVDASRILDAPPQATFSPTASVIAALDRSNGSIILRDCSPALTGQTASDVETSYYRNAKVLLVGDTGVGKSGLGLVLTGQPWVPTESTHARKVWTVSTDELTHGGADHETRETLLWDLAGQPDYRLIHQLHLREIAVALVVFDARSITDPLAGVRHWVRALNHAQRIQGSASLPLRKLLVAAREDVGRVSIPDDGLRQIADNYGFDDVFKTSAKESWGVPELSKAIAASIQWDSLPKGSSNQIFQSIKAFLILERQSGRALSSVSDLFRTYVASDPEFGQRPEAKAEFTTCIGLIESRDLIHRLSFGDLVLLQPELLDAYATAIVNAAKDEPGGLGTITEEIVRLGAFRMPESERVEDKQQERLLLLATIEELLRHEIALRDGSQLVFPSQLTRESPDLPDAEDKAISYTLEGPIANMYATLAVRLSQSGLFKRVDMWKNGVTYRAKVGGVCGILLKEIDDGSGTFTVFFDYAASAQTRAQFEDYVQTHLQRFVGAEGLHTKRPLRCRNLRCQIEIPEEMVTRRQERGFSHLNCPVCDDPIPISKILSDSGQSNEDVVYRIDTAADRRRDQEIQSSILEGKRALGDFEVYLAYDRAARTDVRLFARKLEAQGILPWLDEWQGKADWKRSINQDITRIRSGALLVGRDGTSPWGDPQQREVLDYLLSRGRPVFPIALYSGSARAARGYADLPELPFPLQDQPWFDLRDNSDEQLGRFLRALPSTPLAKADTTAIDLQRQLESIKPGKESSTDYHDLITKAVAYVFEPWLKLVRKEQPLNGGAKRVDSLFERKGLSGFFSNLADKHGFLCPYIFLECKNYSADVGNPEYDQLEGRFSRTTTSVGLLTCRQLNDRKGMLNFCRNLVRERQHCILVLQDEDFKELLGLRLQGDYESISDFMASHLREILL